MATLRVSSFAALGFVLAACGPAELIGEQDGGDTDFGTTAPEETTDPTTPAGQGFVGHYFSTWSTPHMHFDDGAGWTSPPGVEMAAEGDGWFVYGQDQGSGSVEFVFNDGADVWDNNGDANYSTQLAEFWVKDGVIYDEMPATGTDSDDGVYCDEVDCGSGECNEEERTCDCDDGFIFDAELETCIEDLCATVECGFGELCDPTDGTCLGACEPDRQSGDFSFCYQTTSSTVAVLARYDGAGDLDLDASTIRLNADVLEGEAIAFDPDTQRIAVTASSLSPSKYAYLFRMRTTGGDDIQPLWVPMWIGDGLRYADFTWHDSILYQVFTDRFLDADPSNNLDNNQGSLAEIDDPMSQWQGGDFRGIIEKIDDGYFESMGINTLWISSPLLNSHNSQPAVDPGVTERFGSYHSYHPISTGYTHLDDFGYDNPIETAFGTPEELHELVDKAHRSGIRVIPDFVANHVQSEANIFDQHPDWFYSYVPCHNNWDQFRVDCWFTADMPDFNYNNAAARQAVIDHAMWLVEEYNFDGFRADALKHMDDIMVRALKEAVVEQLETTVDDHSVTVEPTIFYMVGESLGGWARYHVREDMVQGQVDEEYYNQTKAALLTYNNSIRNLADFAIFNDTAYLSPQEIFGQQGGYPGALMGNFFGNHDQWRALTEAQGDHARLRLAQTFLFTSPGNIPMLYQGDDIGTFGEADPDNRAMHRFDGLSGDEQASLQNAQRVGRVREDHVALRRGTRQTVVLEDFFWVYRVTYEDDEVYVALNRDSNRSWEPPAGFTDVLGNCANGNVPSQRSCIFVDDAE
ncbi:MAG: alpha-amylase family glycosyl hydrolase [Myxococcota bacterium]